MTCYGASASFFYAYLGVDWTASRSSLSDADAAHFNITAAEKAMKQQECNAHCLQYRKALARVQRVVWEQAVALATEFPNHNTQYYYRVIMQSSQRRGRQRSISLWNVFINERKNTQST